MESLSGLRYVVLVALAGARSHRRDGKPRMACRTLLGLLTFMATLGPAVANGDVQTIKVGSSVFRGSVSSFVLPQYPDKSTRAKVQGVAVASVLVETNGSVLSVDVLEAPDSLIGDAVRLAVRRWRFRPFVVLDAPARALGRLVFYFKIVDGKGEVAEPAPTSGR